VDETRPRNQGANLTSWELLQEGVPHKVIADNAGGHYMRRGEVDLCIVGADRIAANGDVANKIGTYQKAVLAKENGIPFYVAAPSSTIDLNCRSGDDIPIEERDEDEVHFVGQTRVTPKGARAGNPAFDVTPAKYITGINHGTGNFQTAMAEVYVGTKFQTVFLRREPVLPEAGPEFLEWCRRWAAAGWIWEGDGELELSYARRICHHSDRQ